jgi:hypothetical protein
LAGREEPSVDASERRDSVTDVHGTIAHFEMAYEPVAERRVRFGPPWSQRWPALVYLAAALAIVTSTAFAYARPMASAWTRWIVEGDRDRPMAAGGLALLVFLSAMATVVRAHMRGVVVREDGIEVRELLALGVPRVRRWAWAQMHRLLIADSSVGIELWDNTFVRLPDVADSRGLAALLARIATNRRVEVRALPPTT